MSVVGVDTEVTSLTTGAGLIIVKAEILSVFDALLELSVTVIVQLLYVPTANSFRVIVLSPAVATVVTLLQLPPYVITPASVVLNVYTGVVSVVGVTIAVFSVIIGDTISDMK